MAAGSVIAKDNNGNIKLSNPNAKEGGTGYSVGDNDLYKLEEVVAQGLMSQETWNDMIQAIRHTIELPNVNMETASDQQIADNFYVYFTMEDNKKVPHSCGTFFDFNRFWK